MGIGIYKYTGSSSPRNDNFLWAMSDKEYQHLQNCIEIFERRTGRIIDEYGDIEFPKGTLMPLKESIEEAIRNEDSKDKLSSLKRLHNTVKTAIQEDTGLGFFGD